MSALNFPIERPYTQQLAHVKIGLVGYGYWGPKLARNFHELSEAKLSAVCDLHSHCRTTRPTLLEHRRLLQSALAFERGHESRCNY